jgi:hypothetical protein
MFLVIQKTGISDLGLTAQTTIVLNSFKYQRFSGFRESKLPLFGTWVGVLESESTSEENTEKNSILTCGLRTTVCMPQQKLLIFF